MEMEIPLQIKQLLYFHKVLQKQCDHLTLVTLVDLRERNKGWAKQIKEIIEAWNLEDDWDVIKTKTYITWKREVEQKAEIKNKEKLLEECINKKRGESGYKIKSKSIVPLIECEEYTRKPQSFMRENNKLITRAYIMGRYGMLQCAANHSAGYATKECRECGVIDDENHRMNFCKNWRDINLYDSSDKVNFDDIYDDGRCPA